MDIAYCANDVAIRDLKTGAGAEVTVVEITGEYEGADDGAREIYLVPDEIKSSDDTDISLVADQRQVLEDTPEKNLNLSSETNVIVRDEVTKEPESSEADEGFDAKQDCLPEAESSGSENEAVEAVVTDRPPRQLSEWFTAWLIEAMEWESYHPVFRGWDPRGRSSLDLKRTVSDDEDCGLDHAMMERLREKARVIRLKRMLNKEAAHQQ